MMPRQQRRPTWKEAKEGARAWMRQNGIPEKDFYARVCAQDNGFRGVFIIPRTRHHHETTKAKNAIVFISVPSEGRIIEVVFDNRPKNPRTFSEEGSRPHAPAHHRV